MRWFLVIALLATFAAIIYAPHWEWADCRRTHGAFYCFMAKAH